MLAHGRGHGQGTLGPDPRRVRPAHHVPHDGRAGAGQSDQRDVGVRRHGQLAGTVPRQPLYLGSAVGGRGVAAGGEGQLPERREDFPVRVRFLHHLRDFGVPGEAGLERGSHLQREAGAAAGAWLYLHADRHGRHHHRALDAVLPAGRRRGKRASRPRSTRVADRSDRRLLHDLGDRLLHHRGLRRRHLQREAARDPGRRRGGPRAASRSANTPSCCSAPACSTPRFSPPAFCRSRPPIRSAKAWASNPASTSAFAKRRFSTSSTRC